MKVITGLIVLLLLCSAVCGVVAWRQVNVVGEGDVQVVFHSGGAWISSETSLLEEWFSDGALMIPVVENNRWGLRKDVSVEGMSGIGLQLTFRFSGQPSASVWDFMLYDKGDGWLVSIKSGVLTYGDELVFPNDKRQVLAMLAGYALAVMEQ